MFLVDANVLIDIIINDADWGRWSASTLAEAATLGPLCINPIIYGEIATAFEDQDELDQLVQAMKLEQLALPYRAAFLASKAFLKYRRLGGHKVTPLPDFFIGAHAAVAGLTLVTRDAKRFRSYFPSMALISPDNP